eukprot:610716-Amphidinium_carterae.1
MAGEEGVGGNVSTCEILGNKSKNVSKYVEVLLAFCKPIAVKCQRHSGGWTTCNMVAPATRARFRSLVLLIESVVSFGFMTKCYL